MSNQQTFGSGGSSPSGDGIIYIQGNDGLNTPANATTHIIGLKGDVNQGVSIDQTGANTETVTVADSAISQKGVIEIASNAEAIAGTDTGKAITADDLKAKLGAQTSHGLAYGAGTAGVVAWLGAATNGQIPIGSTGNAPVIGSITSNGSLDVIVGAGTLQIIIADEFFGSASTTGAQTQDLITVDLGAVAGTTQFEARVKAFESTTPVSSGYNIYATFRTDGASATLVGQQSVFNEDGDLIDADAYFVASGNNAVLQVLGVTGLTIEWDGETEVT